jgi:uncharacterized membrane protein YfcA
VSWVDVVTVVLIVTVGSAIQTAVGFGFGLVSVPLLLWAGYPLPVAVAIAVGAGALQSGYGAYVVRDAIEWPGALRLAAFQVLGMPFGIAAMHYFAASGQAFAKQVVGGALLLVLTVRLAFRPAPRDHVAPLWGDFAAAISGLFSAALGIGGPPLVLYALAHNWDVARTRGFLWVQFVLGTVPLVVIMAYRFGEPTLVAFAASLLLAPCLWAGARLGFFLTHRWNERTLGRAAVVMLYVLAIASLAGPYVLPERNLSSATP